MSLATLYNSLDHEYFQTWLTLSRPERGKHSAGGYLKVSCYLISESDKPPVHGVNEISNNNEIVDDDDSPNFKKANSGIKLIKNPELNSKSYVLNVNIVRAEDLAKLGVYRCDSFVSVRVGNVILKTPVIENNQKPIFSNRMVFPVHFPIMNDKVLIKVWDYSMLTDTFIANAPENPLDDLSFDLNYLQSAGGTIPFKWVNLYGIPKEDRQVKNYF